MEGGGKAQPIQVIQLATLFFDPARRLFVFEKVVVFRTVAKYKGSLSLGCAPASWVAAAAQGSAAGWRRRTCP